MNILTHDEQQKYVTKIRKLTEDGLIQWAPESAVLSQSALSTIARAARMFAESQRQTLTATFSRTALTLTSLDNDWNQPYLLIVKWKGEEITRIESTSPSSLAISILGPDRYELNAELGKLAEAARRSALNLDSLRNELFNDLDTLT